VSGEVSCTVAWDVLCPVKCRVLTSCVVVVY
jgi:hypothetical protein